MSKVKVVVPISGGKDSQVCLALAVDRFGPKSVIALHQNTNFDYSLTYQHMLYMQERYKVKLVNVSSEKYADVPDVMVKERIIVTRFARACTKQLKLRPWFKWLSAQPNKDDLLVYLGMRADESTDRRERYGALSPDEIYRMGDLAAECPKPCAEVKTQLACVDMTTPSVFAFLRDRGDKINPLYARGHARVGCYPCALAGKRDFILAARDPEGRKNIIRIKEAQDYVKSLHPGEDLTGLIKHDLQAILDHVDQDPFGFNDPPDEAPEASCSWCSI